MRSVLYLLNNASVGIFGIILSASFCDIAWTRKKYTAVLGGMAVILLMQGAAVGGSDFVKCVYPLITHIPLAALLVALCGKLLWPFVSVFTAYLCCEVRRWLALFTVAVWSGGPVMQDAVELLVTLPLLLIFVWCAAPSVRSISRHSVSGQCLFGLVPALYYGFDYLTNVYKLILNGRLVILEFMPFVCSVTYLFFAVLISKEERMRGSLEQVRDSLGVQVRQAVREIEAMRESQQKTRIYRHDLRHHMQYLLSCLENGRLEQAQNYIQRICLDLETHPVSFYCENEAANLIFSAFAGRFRKHGMKVSIMAKIPREVHVSENDLCVLLSNALENAFHACVGLQEKGIAASVEVTAYEKKQKLFFQFINSCGDDVKMEKGMPAVSPAGGHGIGVRSICAIVRRYGGIYAFDVQAHKFILRISL